MPVSNKKKRKKVSTRFTVRVETHVLPTEHALSDISKAMECSGFSRRVTTSTGRQFLLPSSEFRISSHRTCREIRDLARKVIAAAGHECAILVTHGTCQWHNLKVSTELN